MIIPSIVLLYLLLLLLYKLTAAVAYSGRSVSGEVFHEWTAFSFYLPWYAAVLVPLIFYVFYPLTINTLVSSIGFIIFLGGVFIRYMAFKELKELSYPQIRVKKNHKLISKSIYKYIRHPVYLGYLLTAFSAPLILNFYIGLVFSFLFIPGLYLRMVKEEEILIEHVKGYKKYVKKSRRVIPFIW